MEARGSREHRPSDRQRMPAPTMSQALAQRPSPMHPIGWVPEAAGALLDVGCNVGEFLGHCREVHPGLRLAGVEVNAAALAAARRRVPGAVLCRAGAGAAEALPERRPPLRRAAAMNGARASRKRALLADDRSIS